MTKYTPIIEKTEPEYFQELRREFMFELLERLSVVTQSEVPLSKKDERDLNNILSLYGMNIK